MFRGEPCTILPAWLVPLIVISERRIYLNILNAVDSDFYVCRKNITAIASLQNAMNKSLKKYLHSIVPKDMHPSVLCC